MHSGEVEQIEIKYFFVTGYPLISTDTDKVPTHQVSLPKRLTVSLHMANKDQKKLFFLPENAGLLQTQDIIFFIK